MGIIKCQKCGSEISDKSTNCIICGYPVIESLNTIKMATVHADVAQKNAVKIEPVKPVIPTSEPVEEKVLPDIKIAVIKVIREITGLGLVEAKGLADNGGNIKENVSADEANELKAKLEEAGATVELV